MNPADFIEPSLADAPALRLVVDRHGRASFVVHGIVTVYSLEQARALLTDRRIAPREPALQPEYVIQYGSPGEPNVYGFQSAL